MTHFPSRRTTPPLSRRAFLRRSGLLGAAGLSLPALLAACGGDDGDSGGSGTSPSGDTSGESGGGGGTGSLFFENWPAYIDEETVGLFAAETGIDFRYTEAYNDNNEYFAKVQPVLGRGQSIDPDILAPTFWMAARFIALGWAQKLPFDAIPNSANLREDLRNPTWDPTGEYSLPWQTGITGIAYNLSATGRELNSVADLFDPAFSGKIGMLTEMRDTIGLILLGEGIDPSTISTFDEAAPAFEKLDAAKSSGQIRQFTGNDYLDDLNVGNFAACVGWSGDILQLAKDNPDVRFVVPEEGGMSWADTMLLITGSESGADAAKWMDYVYDPENAARITEYVGYISPVTGVREVLEAKGGDAAVLAADPLVFPDDATLQRLRSFATLSEEEEAAFDARFAEITGA